MTALVDELDAACPGYVPGSGATSLPYIWVGGFVEHVIAAHRAGRIDEVQAVFAVIERAIGRGGEDANLAVVGFLEDLQNGNLHPDGSTPAEFKSYLGGPESILAWDQLNGFWHAVAATKDRRDS